MPSRYSPQRIARGGRCGKRTCSPRVRMPRILLLGRNGQVGRELQRSLAAFRDVTSWGRQEADLTDLHALEARVQGHAPDIIVNAAAYTAVDKAETDQATAFCVNA